MASNGNFNKRIDDLAARLRASEQSYAPLNVITVCHVDNWRGDREGISMQEAAQQRELEEAREAFRSAMIDQVKAFVVEDAKRVRYTTPYVLWISFGAAAEDYTHVTFSVPWRRQEREMIDRVLHGDEPW